VLRDGTYVKSRASDQLQYGSMLYVRSMIVFADSACSLAQAITIAVRYSCVRRQSQLKPGWVSLCRGNLSVLLRYWGLQPETPSFVLSQPVAVGGKCRAIWFLCLRPGQYPSVHPPLSCRRGQLILSPHTRMPRHHL